MDLPNPKSVSTKTKLGSQEEGASKMPFTDIEIDLLDVKKECLQNAGSVQPTSKLHYIYHIVLDAQSQDSWSFTFFPQVVLQCFCFKAGK